MRFEDIYQWQSERNLTNEEAAEILGVCERTYRRWCRRYDDEGAAGLLDGRLEKAAHNCAPVDEVMEVISYLRRAMPTSVCRTSMISTETHIKASEATRGLKADCKKRDW